MHEHESDNLPPPDASAGHERRDAKVGPLLWAVGALLALAAFVHVLLIGVMWIFERQHERTDPPVSPVARIQQPVAPMLQPTMEFHEITPSMDLKALRLREQQRLKNYGWVDREKGTVHIPIEVAMRKLLEQSQGLAASSATAPVTKEEQ